MPSARRIGRRTSGRTLLLRAACFAAAMLAGVACTAAAVSPTSGTEAPPPTAHSRLPARPAALTTGTPLAAGSRIIKIFNFEERALGNYNSRPMYWRQVSGPGYPAYNTGRFSTRYFRSPRHSFKLTMNGGNVAFRFAPGKLPIDASADYFIIAFVKTSALKHARAQMSGWMADAHNRLLLNTRVNSQRWASRNGKSTWHVLHMFIRGVPAARSLVLQLGLYQPNHLKRKRLGKFALYRQDIHGAAWFDDVTIFQLPRVSISTTAPGNIIRAGATPRLHMAVSDLGSDRLSALLRIRNVAGQILFHKNWPVTSAQFVPWRQAVQPGVLPPGLYRANLQIRDPRGVVVRRHTRFVTLPPLPTPVAARWGLNAVAWPPRARNALPHLARRCRAGMVILPLWSRGSFSPDTPRASVNVKAKAAAENPWQPVLNALQARNVRTIACLRRLPPGMLPRHSLMRRSILNLVRAKPSRWQPVIAGLLTRYASEIDDWQIGGYPSNRRCADPRYAQVYRALYQQLKRFASRPRLMLPWNALSAFHPHRFPHAVLNVFFPPSVSAEEIPAYLKTFQARSPRVFATVEYRDDHAITLGSFARRLVLCASARPSGIFTNLPVSQTTAMGHHNVAPRRRLLVGRTMAALLGTATRTKRLRLLPHLRAFLFEHGGAGTLALFSATRAPVHLALPLGGHAVLYSILGTAQTPPASDGLTTLTVGRTPIIIRHIDAPLIELRSSFALASTRIPAGAGRFATIVSLKNTFAHRLVGTLLLRLPLGWNVSPHQIKFSLPAGQSLHEPVAIHYPFVAPAGASLVRGTIELAGPPATRLGVSTTVHISSNVVKVRCATHITSTGALLIQQVIRNISHDSFNAQAYAMAPNRARQTRFLFSIKPGQTVIEHYRFRNAAGLHKKTAVVGLRRTGGGTLISNFVPLP